MTKPLPAQISGSEGSREYPPHVACSYPVAPDLCSGGAAFEMGRLGTVAYGTAVAPGRLPLGTTLDVDG